MKFVLSLLLIISAMFGLTKQQLILLQQARDIAKNYHTIDGHVFDDTICAIYLTESDAGKNVIGDVNKVFSGSLSLLDASLGPGQIRVATALEMLKKYKGMFPHKYWKYSHKDFYAYKKFLIYKHYMDKYYNILKRYEKMKKTKRVKRVLRWAKREYKYWSRKYNKYWEYYRPYYYKDVAIMNMLLTNPDFYIRISIVKLIEGYNIAYKKHMWNPYFKAISRYNGGWENKKYFRRVMKKMRYVRYLKQKHLIK